MNDIGDLQETRWSLIGKERKYIYLNKEQVNCF